MLILIKRESIPFLNFVSSSITTQDIEQYTEYAGLRIRDFPDHATFKEKSAKLACADKLGVFLSLTLCKKANFEYLSFIK